MPRDYKHRATRRRKHKPVSPWFGMVAGLMLGLFIAFIAYMNLVAPPDTEALAVIPGPPPAAGLPKEAEAVAVAPKPEMPPPPKPRFDFYTILPEMEVIVPEQQITGKQEQGVKRVERPGTYFLQAGSFRSEEQAERFRAELALLGLETGIQKVTINNKDTYHRVRVGPFRDLDALNKARRLLAGQGIDSTLVRIKG